MDYLPEMSYKRLIKLFLGLTAIELLIHFVIGLLGFGFNNLGLEMITPYFTIISSLVVLYVLLEKFCRKKGFKLKITYLPKANEIFAMISLMLGYNLIYGSTVGLLLTNVKEAAWMIEAIDEMLKYPVILVLEVVILGPIIEEIVYRGILLEYLAQKYGNLKALLFTSFLFGLIHLNWHQSVNAFFMGLLMGWVYLKTRNLLHTLALHMIQNGFAVGAMLIVKDMSMETPESAFEISVLMFGALLFWLGFLFVKNYDGEEYKNIKFKERWLKYFDGNNPNEESEDKQDLSV